MRQSIAITLGVALLWTLGSAWYYDCKIKRVCGPSESDASVVTPATDSPTVVASTGREPQAETPTTAPPPAAEEEDFTGVILSVQFDARSAAVQPPPDVEARLALLRRGIATGHRIQVLGHSDGVGARARIAVVSLQRAEALRDWLLSQGIPAQAIAGVESREDREPIASNSHDEGRRKNRRAEAVLLP
jgi:outer membrane protein OmpA-like peptidoglycan-associated protein